MNTPSKWTPSRVSVPITGADHERLLRAAYLACGPGKDVREAMEERIGRALDALEREERERPRLAEGTMPGTERVR